MLSWDLLFCLWVVLLKVDDVDMVFFLVLFLFVDEVDRVLLLVFVVIVCFLVVVVLFVVDIGCLKGIILCYFIFFIVLFDFVVLFI